MYNMSVYCLKHRVKYANSIREHEIYLNEIPQWKQANLQGVEWKCAGYSLLQYRTLYVCAHTHTHIKLAQVDGREVNLQQFFWSHGF
jgi:hypothetical protein